MICRNCGSTNNESNKFCTHCGVDLPLYEKLDLNYCSKCGFENDPQNKFCVSCGNKLQDKTQEVHDLQLQHAKSRKQRIREERNRNKHEHPKTERYNLKSMKIFWITTAVVMASILGITAFIETSDSNFTKTEISIPEKISEVNSSDPLVETKVYEIASKFVCSCGTCNEESLEICKCERGVEERQFIRDYLQQNQTPNDIVVALANRYGWMKAEFASTYNVNPTRVWNPNQTTGQTDQLLITKVPPVSNLINTKATILDKISIYSAFNCPCGKCTIDELKDCNCSHPNGAKEVKRFIDEKIFENRYTLNQIIELVNSKYSGKKI